MAGSFNGDGPYVDFDAGVVRFDADGSVDTSFADDGKLVFDQAAGWDEAEAVLVQSDGKVVVAGVTTPPDSSFRGFVMRLLPTGQPDPSFQGGLVLLPPETAVLAASLAPGGKIIVAGWSGQSTLAARLLPDGSLDPSFGAGGLVTQSDPGFGGATVALADDGSVVVAGSHIWGGYGPTSDAVVVRFTGAGALDTTFGGRGVVRTRLGSPTGPRGVDVTDMAIDGQGSIVLAGSAFLHEDNSPFPIPGSPVIGEPRAQRRLIDSDVALIRYLPDGSLDPSLGGTGKLAIPIPTNPLDARPPGLSDDSSGTLHRESRAEALAIDPEGRLLVAGSVGQPGWVAAVMRFTPGGLLDPTFGTGGVSAVAQPFDMDKPSGGFFTAMALLPDGRLVAAGRMYDATQFSLVVARFLPGSATTSVWAWGWNGVGQLGDGTTTERHTPVPMTGLSGVVSVSAGSFHTLALRGDGTVWAWGWNVAGQLGDGTTIDRWKPVPVPGLAGVIAVAAGSYHSLALTGDGTVWAWGWNPLGQLGDGTTETRLSPVRVAGLTGAAAIAADGYHSVAARDDGTLWGWGWNGVEQLGSPTPGSSPVPSPVEVPVWASTVAAGSFTSTALGSQTIAVGMGMTVADGEAVVSHGQWLGFHLIRASGGLFHDLVLQDDGVVLARGWNGVGQLGDGTVSDERYSRPVPGLKAMEIAAGATTAWP